MVQLETIFLSSHEILIFLPEASEIVGDIGSKWNADALHRNGMCRKMNREVLIRRKITTRVTAVDTEKIVMAHITPGFLSRRFQTKSISAGLRCM